MEVVSCPYFTTSVFELSEAVEKDLSGLQAVPGNFYIVMGLEGSGSVTGSDGTAVQINAGEALLVLGEQELRFEPNGHLTLLTTR